MTPFSGPETASPHHPKRGADSHLAHELVLKPHVGPLRADFWEGDEDSNFSIFRVQQWHWMARTSLNCLSCLPPFHWKTLFHWKVLRRIPFPKIGTRPRFGVDVSVFHHRRRAESTKRGEFKNQFASDMWSASFFGWRGDATVDKRYFSRRGVGLYTLRPPPPPRAGGCMRPPLLKDPPASRRIIPRLGGGDMLKVAAYSRGITWSELLCRENQLADCRT